jgi:DNA-binding transcriptional MerR regulator
MKYTVSEISKLAGISVRTLHYYDEIGLLKPSQVGKNGYRYYGEKELIKLQQILFYKELEFSLDQIIKIINSSEFDIGEALNSHKKLLLIKKMRIDKLIKAVDKSIKNLRGGTMDTSDLYGSFSKDEYDKYKEEAKRRWGHTKAYKQSTERIKNWTKEDFKKMEEEAKNILEQVVINMDKGIESDEVQEQIERYHKHISVYYDCPIEVFRGLGNMYVEDKRFTAYYDKFDPRLAVFMRDAMSY